MTIYLYKVMKCISVRDLKNLCNWCVSFDLCRRLVFFRSFHLEFPSTILYLSSLCNLLFLFLSLSPFNSLFVALFSAPFLSRPVSQGGVLGHIQQWANAKLSKHEARTNGSLCFLPVCGLIFASWVCLRCETVVGSFFWISNGFTTANYLTRWGLTFKHTSSPNGKYIDVIMLLFLFYFISSRV